MNTPAHMLINMAALSRTQWVPHTWITCGSAALIGAVLPDAFMFVFYIYERLILGTPDNIIWQTRYFLPQWQAVFDVFNSFPLIVLLFIVGYVKRSPFIQVLAASMFLHCLLDFPLHNDDAHRHFYPLTDCRFFSPFSSWDPAHYGFYFLSLEAVLGVISAIILIFSHQVRWVRYFSVLILFIYALFGVFVYFVWFNQ